MVMLIRKRLISQHEVDMAKLQEKLEMSVSKLSTDDSEKFTKLQEEKESAKRRELELLQAEYEAQLERKEQDIEKLKYQLQVSINELKEQASQLKEAPDEPIIEAQSPVVKVKSPAPVTPPETPTLTETPPKPEPQPPKAITKHHGPLPESYEVGHRINRNAILSTDITPDLYQGNNNMELIHSHFPMNDPQEVENQRAENIRRLKEDLKEFGVDPIQQIGLTDKEFDTCLADLENDRAQDDPAINNRREVLRQEIDDVVDRIAKKRLPRKPFYKHVQSCYPEAVPSPQKVATPVQTKKPAPATEETVSQPRKVTFSSDFDFSDDEPAKSQDLAHIKEVPVDDFSIPESNPPLSSSVVIEPEVKRTDPKVSVTSSVWDQGWEELSSESPVQFSPTDPAPSAKQEIQEDSMALPQSHTGVSAFTDDEFDF